MKKLTSTQIRQKWLDFFVKNDHLQIPSASLVPKDDKSLLWINAGVAPLKKYFSGLKNPPYPNLVNAQKVLRTNDLENVGITARHNTFFEMLGNFSIGNYFKEKAIKLALDFLINELEIDIKKLFITYHYDDIETKKNWLQNGIAESNLIPGGDEVNFWKIGIGPCGYSTEIFYDRGPQYDFHNYGIDALKNDLENDRYIEVWNIVFSEFNALKDGTLVPLKQKNIDTGAGLERIAMLSQDGNTNFDSDLFLPIIEKLMEFTPLKYKSEVNDVEKDQAQFEINRNFKIIADHIRAIALTISEGVIPSNTGNGYIVRRLIRKSLISKYLLNLDSNFELKNLVKVVKEILKHYQIDVLKVEKVIIEEQKMFQILLERGKKAVKQFLIENSAPNFQKIVNFALFNFDTNGIPINLVLNLIKNQYKLDFQKVIDLRNLISKAKKDLDFKNKEKLTQNAISTQKDFLLIYDKNITKFVGYETTSINSQLVNIFDDKTNIWLLFKETPFYETSGGQEKDFGKINNIDVHDIIKDKFNNIWHKVSKDTKWELSSNYDLVVNSEMRKLKSIHHSLTHLLNWGLREVIDSSIKQIGSFNNEYNLRLDFSWKTKPSQSQLDQIEEFVAKKIKTKINRKYSEVDLDEAKNQGVILLDKFDYQQKVRVVSFNDYRELCGGTHVENTEQIEAFKIIKCETKGQNKFRIEAIGTNKLVQQFLFSKLFSTRSEIKTLIIKNRKFDSKYDIRRKLVQTKDYLEISQYLKNFLTSNLEQEQKNFNVDVKFLNKALNFSQQILDDLKKDNKKFKKNFLKTSLNYSTHETIYQGISTILIEKIEPNLVRNLAIKMREKYPQKLVVVKSKFDQNLIIAFASYQNDANAFLQKAIKEYGGKGGGMETLAIGKLEQDFEFKR